MSCPNRGGVHASPADCPTADFVGKCTLPAVPSGVVLTTRHYTGADVGAVAAFLLSPLGSGVTGTVVYVDKGYHTMGKATEERYAAP